MALSVLPKCRLARHRRKGHPFDGGCPSADSSTKGKKESSTVLRSPNNFPQDFFMFEISYCIAVLLIKLSIALMLTRIASKKPLFVWIIRATIALFLVVIIMVCLYILFECQPIRYETALQK